MTGAWEIVAIVAAAWSATSLAGAAVQGLKPRPVDLMGQFSRAAFAAAGLGAAIFLLGVGIDLTTAAFALGLGLAVGFGASSLAGYQDDAGEAVISGSGWYLFPWGVSAVAMLWASLARSPDALAGAILALFVATGVGVGQLAASTLAVRKVSRAWDNRPLPPDLDIVAELTAERTITAPPATQFSPAVEACPARSCTAESRSALLPSMRRRGSLSARPPHPLAVRGLLRRVRHPAQGVGPLALTHALDSARNSEAVVAYPSGDILRRDS